VAANYLRDNLHQYLFKDPVFKKNPTIALVNAIQKCSKEIDELNNKEICSSQVLVILILED
jgi:hypothetical protein